MTHQKCFKFFSDLNSMLQIKHLGESMNFVAIFKCFIKIVPVFNDKFSFTAFLKKKIEEKIMVKCIYLYILHIKFCF